jgi:hypothetical protein
MARRFLFERAGGISCCPAKYAVARAKNGALYAVRAKNATRRRARMAKLLLRGSDHRKPKPQPRGTQEP